MLSSYESLAYLLDGTHDGADKSTPSSDSLAVRSLIDELVVVDTSEKVGRLLNFEEEHRAGLELVLVLTSCLDTLLLLDVQFSLRPLLLRLQQQCLISAEEGDAIRSNSLPNSYLIDPHSVLRHRILVRTRVVEI